MYFSHKQCNNSASSAGFTLIELLVVIAIISILAVVVILTLNPAELLRQGRDSNRLSDMASINEALGVYSEDQGSASNLSLGSSSVVYVSIPDPIATSTAGDQCQGLGLTSLPSTYTYHCVASSTLRNINGTGWIPVNLSLISSGSPIASLPIDPTNSSSSHLYYTYDTNGTQYETTAAMESQKYGVGGSGDVISGDGGVAASVYEKGTKLGLEPLDYGDPTLVGYWPLNEGTGTVVYDYSGNGFSGNLSSTPQWVPGKIGPNAYNVVPSGSANGISISITSSKLPATAITVSEWIDVSQNVNYPNYLNNSWAVQPGGWLLFSLSSGQLVFGVNGPGSATQNNATGCNITTSTWHFVAGTYDGSNVKSYLDGVLCATTPFSGQALYQGSGTATIADYLNATSGNFYSDDIRLYSRALSAAQIAGMYNGGK